MKPLKNLCELIWWHSTIWTGKIYIIFYKKYTTKIVTTAENIKKTDRQLFKKATLAHSLFGFQKLYGIYKLEILLNLKD